MYFALGSLFTLKDPILSPEEKIKQALDTAAYFNPFVGGEYTILKSDKEV